MTTDTSSPVPVIEKDPLSDGFVPISHPTLRHDLSIVATPGTPTVTPVEVVPIVVSPEEVKPAVGIAESSPHGDVIVISDESRNFYAVIRGRGNINVSKKAAKVASQTLNNFLSNNESVNGDSAGSIDFMKRAIDEIDDAIDTSDEGLDGTLTNGKPTNGKEMHYDISALQLVKDENGEQRAVFANIAKGLIIEHDADANTTKLISQESDEPEFAAKTNAFNGNKPRLISITEPINTSMRFILAPDSVPENIVRNGHSKDEFLGAVTSDDAQDAASRMLALSETDKGAKGGRAAVVIDTAAELPITPSAKNTLALVPPVIEISKEAIHKRLINVMGQAALSLKSFGSKLSERSDQARSDRILKTATRIANTIKLSPVTTLNKISDYTNKTKDWYEDSEKGSGRKHKTIGAVAGVLAVAAVAGYLDSRTGGIASHHLSEAKRHTAGHKLGKLTTADRTKLNATKMTSTKASRKPVNIIKPSSSNVTPVSNATSASATPKAAVAAPATYTNETLTPGSNPWVVARQSLQSSGNLNPTNAQILVQDNAILTANHITAQQAASLPVGTLLRVPTELS